MSAIYTDIAKNPLLLAQKKTSNRLTIAVRMTLEKAGVVYAPYATRLTRNAKQSFVIGTSIRLIEEVISSFWTEIIFFQHPCRLGGRSDIIVGCLYHYYECIKRVCISLLRMWYKDVNTTSLYVLFCIQWPLLWWLW